MTAFCLWAPASNNELRHLTRMIDIEYLTDCNVLWIEIQFHLHGHKVIWKIPIKWKWKFSTPQTNCHTVPSGYSLAKNNSQNIFKIILIATNKKNLFPRAHALCMVPINSDQIYSLLLWWNIAGNFLQTNQSQNRVILHKYRPYLKRAHTKIGLYFIIYNFILPHRLHHRTIRRTYKFICSKFTSTNSTVYTQLLAPLYIFNFIFLIFFFVWFNYRSISVL